MIQNEREIQPDMKVKYHPSDDDCHWTARKGKESTL